MIDKFLQSNVIPELKSSVLSFYDTDEEKEELEQFNSDNEWMRALMYNKPATPFLKTSRQKRLCSPQFKKIRRN